MGFDCIGQAAKTETGEYYRNNCWWWRPLWNFTCGVCKDIITKEEAERGSYNDGIHISADKAQRIAIRLEYLVHQGEVAKYEKEYKKNLEEIPDEACDICKGTGKRNDQYVVGECNACHGKGERRPWQTHYPFEETNVKGFAKFCKESGGFEIW